MERKKVKQNLPSFPISRKWQSRSKFRPGHRIFHIALFFRKFHKVKFEICNKVKISIFRNQFKEILDRKGGQTWDPARKFSLLTWRLMSFTGMPVMMLTVSSKEKSNLNQIWDILSVVVVWCGQWLLVRLAGKCTSGGVDSFYQILSIPNILILIS